MKKYKVTLTADVRQQLREMIATGKAAAQKPARARILLEADAADGGPARTGEAIADAVEVGTDTVARVRRRSVEDGLDAALARKKAARPPVPPKLDGRAEARPVALACSSPPDGRTRWAMRLPADRPVELEVVGTVSDETVRRTLEKTGSSRGWGSSGASRPRPTPRSCVRRRTCSTCTTARTIRSGRWSPRTRRASSWSARRCSRSPRNRGSRSGPTTSTSGTGRRTCSCCRSPRPGGGTWR
ncbi:MAG: hypothetical protein C0501_29075 [Isosphaera sp.]|nr:hypothetical protein [Isosphaera sp.]